MPHGRFSRKKLNSTWVPNKNGDNPPIPVLVLFGPTASGKTEVLLRLFGSGGSAEVVSADSMQVYRGMDIGTAKPSAGQLELLPHHLIDICDPSEQFNAGDFVRLAGESIADIARRGKIPVVSGGTGFYLKNLILGLPEAPPSDAAIRGELRRELEEKGAAALMEELSRVDPASAQRIHINDIYRLLRALEVFRACGQPLSCFGSTGQRTGQGAMAFNFLVFGLHREREELYRRINARCEAMFAQGLSDEVQRLYDAGYTPDDPGLRAIGYHEFFVRGESAANNGKYRLSKDIAGIQALVAQNSRRYAKRQVTFFASLPNVTWIKAGRDNAETAEQLWTEISMDG